MAVAVARPLASANGKLIDHEVTLRSLVRLLHQVLPPARFGQLVDLRDGEMIAILSCESEPARGFLKAVRRHGIGRGAGVGVSLDAAAVAGLPQAVEEARLALGFANPAQALVHFGEIDLQDFLLRRAEKAALRLIPAWAGDLTGDLAATIRAFAESSLNVKQTARRLGVHANTVYFRLERIRRVTGVDPRSFSGASLLVTALRLRQGL